MCAEFGVEMVSLLVDSDSELEQDFQSVFRAKTSKELVRASKPLSSSRRRRGGGNEPNLPVPGGTTTQRHVKELPLWDPQMRRMIQLELGTRDIKYDVDAITRLTSTIVPRT